MDYIKQQGYEILNIENIIECKVSIVFDINKKHEVILINNNIEKLKEETIKDLFNTLTNKQHN